MLQVRPYMYFEIYTYVHSCSYVLNFIITKTDDVTDIFSFLHVHVCVQVGLLNLPTDEKRGECLLNASDIFLVIFKQSKNVSSIWPLDILCNSYQQFIIWNANTRLSTQTKNIVLHIPLWISLYSKYIQIMDFCISKCFSLTNNYHHEQ